MDGFFWIILLMPVISAIGWSLQASSLQSKFAKLGNLSGRSRNEIIAKVGNPSSVSVVGPNQTLMQWQITGYHIALIFNGETCSGITHEYSMGSSSIQPAICYPVQGAKQPIELDVTRSNVSVGTLNLKCVGCDTPIPYGATKCPMCLAPIQGQSG